MKTIEFKVSELYKYACSLVDISPKIVNRENAIMFTSRIYSASNSIVKYKIRKYLSDRFNEINRSKIVTHNTANGFCIRTNKLENIIIKTQILSLSSYLVVKFQSCNSDLANFINKNCK